MSAEKSLRKFFPEGVTKHLYLEKEIRHGNVIEKIKYTNGRFGIRKKNGPAMGTTPPEQKEWQKKRLRPATQRRQLL